MIPAQAVEGAAKAAESCWNQWGTWEDVALAALEAAAPHMLRAAKAEAWDEGRDVTIEAYDGRGDGSNPYMLNNEGEK